MRGREGEEDREREKDLSDSERARGCARTGVRTRVNDTQGVEVGEKAKAYARARVCDRARVCARRFICDLTTF